jgi:hypothetical protein
MQEFMSCVEAGRLPPEFGNDDRDVELINNKSQPYVPPKRDITRLEGTTHSLKLYSLTGAGQSLGGSAVKTDYAVAQQVDITPTRNNNSGCR